MRLPSRVRNVLRSLLGETARRHARGYRARVRFDPRAPELFWHPPRERGRSHRRRGAPLSTDRRGVSCSGPGAHSISEAPRRRSRTPPRSLRICGSHRSRGRRSHRSPRGPRARPGEAPRHRDGERASCTRERARPRRSRTVVEQIETRPGLSQVVRRRRSNPSRPADPSPRLAPGARTDECQIDHQSRLDTGDIPADDRRTVQPPGDRERRARSRERTPCRDLAGARAKERRTEAFPPSRRCRSGSPRRAAIRDRIP